MKNSLYVFVILLFTVLMLNNTSHAQATQDTVFLHLSIQCSHLGAFQLSPDTVVEGEIYTISSYTLPSNYSKVQGLYNALVGTQFYFENGALNQNIDVYFNISDIDCSSGFYNVDPNSSANFFFHADFAVDTIVNGQPVFVKGSYYFKNGKHAVLKIKRTTQFNNFIKNTGVDISKTLEYVYVLATGGFTNSGITTTVDTDYVTAKMSHFSSVAGGNKSSLTGIKDENSYVADIPSDYVLEQNYPNPFNPSTTIEYALPVRSFIKINVYNILGVKVASLVKGYKSAGIHSVTFDAKNLSSGLYFYELRSNNLIKTRKMLLLK